MKEKNIYSACRNGDLSFIKSYFKKSKNSYDIDLTFQWVCTYGHLEILKYLLTSQELIHHRDIDYDHGFRYACANGRLDVVKYLLTSPELKEHADIHVWGDYGFKSACMNGHLDVVKYLLTSPDLKEHIDVHTNYDYGFKSACEESRINVVEYLLEYVGHYPLYQFCIKKYIEKGNIDLLPYLKSNKKEETEECEIFL